MIRISKAPEPEWFAEWKKQKSQVHHLPPESHIENVKLRETLIDEQGSLCCYCGQGIDSGGSHIEHFRPRSKYPDLETEYGNMHASCESKSSCGTAKGDSFDEALCISSLEVEEGRFFYTLEGEVRPKDHSDEAAAYMIKILNLNAIALVGMRKELLTKVLPPGLMDGLSSDELQKLRSAYQERDAEPRFQAFRQVLTCYIDQQH